MGTTKEKVYKLENRLEYIKCNATWKDRKIENMNKQKRPTVKCQKIKEKNTFVSKKSYN